MDAKTYLQKLQYVGVLAFATTDEHGAPQIRNICAIHYEPEAMYFFTASGRVPPIKSNRSIVCIAAIAMQYVLSMQ